MLTPMHRGPAGALNALLQDALTPARPDRAEKRCGGRGLRIGDKVS
jgi:exodeoxyribonuclease V alpha subunit